MSGFLGIDHPLLLVNDIVAASARLEALGFRMAPIGKHPWGTSTALAMFQGCSLELMGIYDETLIDEKPTGDFKFGRFVRDDLAKREGISLLALHSEDAGGDATKVAARGVACQGTIEFGRDVTLPDGRKDRTATTLKILWAEDLPRLSNFVCHQHRPDLIYVSNWLEHPNRAFGICRVTILAEVADHARVRMRLAGLYGSDALFEDEQGFGVRTGNGDFIVVDRSGAKERYGALPPALKHEQEPCYIGVDIRVPDVESVLPFVEASGTPHRRDADVIVLTDAASYGNVFLAFVPQVQANA